jgi:hypothetical protein
MRFWMRGIDRVLEQGLCASGQREFLAKGRFSRGRGGCQEKLVEGLPG